MGVLGDDHQDGPKRGLVMASPSDPVVLFCVFRKLGPSFRGRSEREIGSLFTEVFEKTTEMSPVRGGDRRSDQMTTFVHTIPETFEELKRAVMRESVHWMSPLVGPATKAKAGEAICVAPRVVLAVSDVMIARPRNHVFHVLRVAYVFEVGRIDA
jgi:hypothetical protein